MKGREANTILSVLWKARRRGRAKARLEAILFEKGETRSERAGAARTALRAEPTGATRVAGGAGQFTRAQRVRIQSEAFESVSIE